MRYKMSYGVVWGGLLKAAEGVAKSISDHPFAGNHEDLAYHAYPRFLLYCLNEEMREALFFSWETPQDFEPLHIYLANTHHWKISEVRQMNEDDLLVALRFEIRQMKLSQAQIDALLVIDWTPEAVKVDAQSRAQTAD